LEIFADRTVVVTGGTGSFGHRFVHRILKEGHPKSIRIFSRDELKQYHMSRLFEADERLRFFVGDVRDSDRLKRALHGADIVIHAAALKQVPACEYNPFEAVKTNILGTQNVAAACIDEDVSLAIAISTDKAVSPANLYGATKLCAEKLFIQSNAYAGSGKTRLSCVRYGNVVGSRGSVVPLFAEQAAAGELTITDKEMTRFWISLDQAVDLVVLALKRMRGGEVFIPKVPSMRVVDLAAALAPGVPISFTGIRPGEKLHESLLTTEESRHSFEYEDHFVLMPEYPLWELATAPGGKPLPDRFAYTSDSNNHWLSSEALSGLLVASEQEVSHSE